jgi:hypothetical protein
MQKTSAIAIRKGLASIDAINSAVPGPKIVPMQLGVNQPGTSSVAG